jgi:hypothetical protein
MKIMACGRRPALLFSKGLLLVHLVERRSDLGLVAKGHIDLVGAGSGSHGDGMLSSVEATLEVLHFHSCN